MTPNCSYLNSMNLYVIFVGITGFCFNIFTGIVCCTKIRKQGLQSSKDVLFISLVLMDVLTVSVPLPIYLSMFEACSNGQPTNLMERSTICEIFYLMFVWLKLSSLFVITTLNYSSYLAITAKGIYRSLGETLSASMACSRHRQNHREKKKSVIVIANLVVGIAIVAFTIASFPYVGLGPDGVSALLKDDSRSNSSISKFMCSLDRFSYPKKSKEYTFLFAVLMSSAACCLLQVVHNILSFFSCVTSSFRDVSTSCAQTTFAIYNRRIGQEREFAKLICVLGVSFHLTWIPVMDFICAMDDFSSQVAIGRIMSGSLVSIEFSQYVIAASLLPPCLDPVFFAIFLTDFREVSMVVLNFLPGKLIRVFKDVDFSLKNPRR
ncbi:PREDICTED: uncharacterized protein LOC107352424 isoform X2 [Acropora digitifera]|uniref:uncharacterized protein LOC107352424 isoform X2 n=1 Tax=Acropora digitifera TaxID=70779 RepID=UPI00077A1399|nr:PREDICTED: uncharacterized protein LOC107352424 isoform X2 [Acropora digitifera]